MLPDDFFEQRLVDGWERINRRVFGGALLVAPAFQIVEMGYHAADWNASKRLIRFSRAFVETRPWLTVLEVLKHEMAHQYVSDVLGVEDETSHGPAFRMVCHRYGIDGRASGIARTEREEHAIDKIKKLLNLGASPNENEANAALTKARKLLDEYGLTENDLRSSALDDYGVAHLGDVVLRKTPEDHRMVVCTILSKFFRVRVIWATTHDAEGRPGLQLEICGRLCDVAIAEHVHDFLHAEATRLWNQASGAGKRDKLDFFEGVMRGFLETLCAEEKARAAAASGSSAGLVHVAEEGQLDDYFERRHPKTVSLRGSRRQRGARFHDGVSAGRNISLNKPMSGDGPKLLGRGE